MNLGTTTIVLVGLCNADPYSQILIGTIVFRQNSKNQLEPYLINDTGTPSNPSELVFSVKRKGRYAFYCSQVGGNDVLIYLDVPIETFRFTTGIGRGDSGAGGPIANGGPELVSALDQLFRFNRT